MSLSFITNNHQELRESVAPPLRVIQGERQQKKKISPLFLALTAVLGVISILAAQLWLNLSLSSGAYEISELTVQERDLSRAERVLKLDVGRLSSPQNLAVEASALGMVQNLKPAYLNLKDATIAGSVEQMTTSPRANLVDNSALKQLKEKKSPKPIAVKDVTPEKPAVAKKETSKDTVVKKEQKAAPVEKPVEKKQAGPKQNSSGVAIAWEGKLVAPVTR